jgi:hypothetical protein
MAEAVSRQPLVAHFSFHKCLTVFMKSVLKHAAVTYPGERGRVGYRHLASHLDHLSDALDRYRVVSLNNHAVNLDDHGITCATRFVRDPRDLLVSGYFYHLRGAERWTRITDPTAEDWKVVGAALPDLPPGHSLTSYLQSVSKEEGIRTELEMRRPHFHAMNSWRDDARVLVVRYEDFLGSEADHVSRMLRHLKFGRIRTALDTRRARSLAIPPTSTAGRASSAPPTVGHIRDARPEQWREHVPESVLHDLGVTHPGLLDRYGYS